MADTTAKLQLPYILPAQAQKHLTHNEALQRLDAATQLVIKSEITAPPQAVEAQDDCFLIAANPQGAFAGKAGQIAFRQDGAWAFLTPRQGWRTWFADSQKLKILRQDGWQDVLPDKASFAQLGIGTQADGFNRLALAAPASLFSHEAAGGGHQIKINKKTAGDTASLLFQSGWSGRTEMGLAGNDGFSIKTSADGGTWTTALTISGAGHVFTPQRPLAQAAREAGNFTPANGSVSGFTTLETAQGGFALGNPVAGGADKELRVPASGLYLAILSLAVISSSGHTAALRINGKPGNLVLNGGTGMANTLQSASFLVKLAEKDSISLAHTGTCQLAGGPGKTGLTLILL